MQELEKAISNKNDNSSSNNNNNNNTNKNNNKVHKEENSEYDCSKTNEIATVGK